MPWWRVACERSLAAAQRSKEVVASRPQERQAMNPVRAALGPPVWAVPG